MDPGRSGFEFNTRECARFSRKQCVRAKNEHRWTAKGVGGLRLDGSFRDVWNCWQNRESLTPQLMPRLAGLPRNWWLEHFRSEDWRPLCDNAGSDFPKGWKAEEEELPYSEATSPFHNSAKTTHRSVSTHRWRRCLLGEIPRYKHAERCPTVDCAVEYSALQYF